MDNHPGGESPVQSSGLVGPGENTSGELPMPGIDRDSFPVTGISTAYPAIASQHSIEFLPTISDVMPTPGATVGVSEKTEARLHPVTYGDADVETVEPLYEGGLDLADRIRFAQLYDLRVAARHDSGEAEAAYLRALHHPANAKVAGLVGSRAPIVNVPAVRETARPEAEPEGESRFLKVANGAAVLVGSFVQMVRSGKDGIANWINYDRDYVGRHTKEYINTLEPKPDASEPRSGQELLELTDIGVRKTDTEVDGQLRPATQNSEGIRQVPSTTSNALVRYEGEPDEVAAKPEFKLKDRVELFFGNWLNNPDPEKRSRYRAYTAMGAAALGLVGITLDQYGHNVADMLNVSDMQPATDQTTDFNGGDFGGGEFGEPGGNIVPDAPPAPEPVDHVDIVQEGDTGWELTQEYASEVTEGREFTTDEMNRLTARALEYNDMTWESAPEELQAGDEWRLPDDDIMREWIEELDVEDEAA